MNSTHSASTFIPTSRTIKNETIFIRKIALETDFKPHRKEFPYMDQLMSCKIDFETSFSIQGTNTYRKHKRARSGHITISLSYKNPETYIKISPEIVTELIGMATKEIYGMHSDVQCITYSIVVKCIDQDIRPYEFQPAHIVSRSTQKTYGEMISQLINIKSIATGIEIPSGMRIVKNGNTVATYHKGEINVWQFDAFEILGEKQKIELPVIRELLSLISDNTCILSFNTSFVVDHIPTIKLHAISMKKTGQDLKEAFSTWATKAICID